MTKQRYHFLDGLRGVAMLLGLVLHGVMSFAGIVIWPATDVRSAPGFFTAVIDVIHGFRMPLFFLVSGFFTMMMAKRKGLKYLLTQRLLRIGVPLVVGTIIIYPLMSGLGEWGARVKAERAEIQSQSGVERGEGLMSSILEGREDRLRRVLEGGGDPNERDEAGTPMLTVAAIVGQADCVQVLIDFGADVDARGEDGGTALISAAFFGRTESLQILLKAGADLEAENTNGDNALKAATMDFEIVRMIAGVIALPVDDGMNTRREKIAEILREHGAMDEAKEEGSIWDLYWWGVFYPVFHHLWFLYDLLWLVGFFLPAYWLARKFSWRVPDLLLSAPWCLLWLVPLTWWAQSGMVGTFGTGTSTGVLPWPTKLSYYAVFFFFGTICYGRGIWEQQVGRLWWAWILVAAPLFWYGRKMVKESDPLIGQLLASAYCWAMIIAMMGLFRRFLNTDNSKVRYLSDSSYWLYLAHLPAMMMVQVFICNWEIPLVIKLSLVILGVTGVLLVIYEYVIRYTGIGAILNGRKTR